MPMLVMKHEIPVVDVSKSKPITDNKGNYDFLPSMRHSGYLPSCIEKRDASVKGISDALDGIWSGDGCCAAKITLCI